MPCVRLRPTPRARGPGLVTADTGTSAEAADSGARWRRSSGRRRPASGLLTETGAAWELLTETGAAWDLLTETGTAWELLTEKGAAWDLQTERGGRGAV